MFHVKDGQSQVPLLVKPKVNLPNCGFYQRGLFVFVYAGFVVVVELIAKLVRHIDSRSASCFTSPDWAFPGIAHDSNPIRWGWTNPYSHL